MLLAIGLGGLGIVAAQVASAHNGQASITCTSVTFVYTSFSGAENTVYESVVVDGAGVYADTFTFDGSIGAHTVDIAVPHDGEEHLIEVGAGWSTNGHQGSFSSSARLVCGEKPPTPPDEPPGPPHVCPDGLPPDAGKDGKEGNDDCDHTQPPVEETVPPATPPLTRVETPPAPAETTSAPEETTPAPDETTPAPAETTPSPAETTPSVTEPENPAIVGTPPVSKEKPKAQKNVKGKAVAATPDTTPQASPHTR
jgi:hypothetical protein